MFTQEQEKVTEGQLLIEVNTQWIKIEEELNGLLEKQKLEDQKPKLLTLKEERELAIAIESGDLAARDKLFEANKRLVGSVVNRFGRGDFEELNQEGYIALLRAIDRYDFRREVKFSTFAYWYIKGAILDAKKRARKQSYFEVPLVMEAVNRQISTPAAEEVATEYIFNKQLREALEDLIKGFRSSKTRLALTAQLNGNFGYGSSEELAGKLGITPKSARQLNERGIKRFRRQKLMDCLKPFMEDLY